MGIQRYSIGPDEAHPGWNEMVPNENGPWVRLDEVEDKANLGLATTYDLIKELMARAEVDKTIGKTWPLYTTVGGEPITRGPIELKQ